MQQFQSIQNKILLRKYCKEIRLKLLNDSKISQISDNIIKKISLLSDFKKAQHIMFYYAKKDEINLLALLDFEKKFYLPRVNGQNMDICPYKKGDKLQKSSFGVMEPTNKPIKDLDILDIILTPALCADKNGNRLGFGGGFYDRFFANPKLKAQKIVVVPEILFFDNIPNEKFDIKCDKVIFA